MLNKLTASQKRGALILLGLIVLVVGWRWRTAWLDSQNDSLSGADTSGVQAATPLAADADKGKEPVRVELNTADTATLQKVKGIGPAYARRIVTFRETYGGIVDPLQLVDALRLQPDAWLRIEPQVYADTTSEAFMALRERAEEKRAYLRSLTANPGMNRKPMNGDRDQPPAFSSGDRHHESPDRPAGENVKPKLQPIDLNRADSSALVTIPGIGPRTAQEILKFRQSVFFIHSPEQVQTLWCVRPENWDRMKDYLLINGPFDAFPHIPINTGDVEALAAHKYLRFKDARLIVAYRDQHGPFQAVDDLRKMHGLEAGLVDRIAPYLAF